MRFLAEGRIGACAWAALAERSIAAFTECGMDLAEVRSPPYTRTDRGRLGARPGYGWLVGESDLCQAKFGFFETKGYESFIAGVQVWIDPALGKGDLDTEQTPHDWIARVRAGRVQSVQVLVRSRGARRQFRGTTKTEDSYGWIAPAILLRLSRIPLP